MKRITLVMTEGGLLHEMFRRKSGQFARKNGFDDDDRLQMEALALTEILRTRDGYDAGKARGRNGRDAYLKTIIGNALRRAAKVVADERSVWQSRQSLDAPLGDDAGMTYGDRLADSATSCANAKLWSEPRCRRIGRLMAKAKKNKCFVQRLEECLSNEERPRVPGEGSCLPDSEAEMPMSRSEHDKAVAEMGLAGDEDEIVETKVHRSSPLGFGDCASSVHANTLHLDIAIAMNDLDPQLKAWCRNVLKGCSPVEAYKEAGFSKSNFYAYVLPRLRVAFADFRYAL